MKILKCYINNFGGLSDFSYDFSDGLNSIARENGFGKTTLSVFIKSMLFGLSDTRKQKLDENDRKHYTPWQGGRFGGSLDFEMNGKKYRIERSFGSKSADDTFKLYYADTGRECTEFTEKIGEEIFLIDADGFERTVFLSEANLSGKNENKTVSAKLSDLSGTDGDLSAMDDAVELLEKERRIYKKHGGKGAIEDSKNRLIELELKIEKAETAKAELEKYEKELENAKRDLQNLENERTKLELTETSFAEKRAKRSLEKHYLKSKAELDCELNSLSALEGFFKNGIPSTDEIDRKKYAMAEAEALSKRVKESSASADYLSLKAFFKTEPDENKIRDAEKALIKAETLKERICGLEEHVKNQPRLSFGTAEVDEHIRLIEKKSPVIPVVIILSVLALAAGGLLGYFINNILFAVCALGVILPLFIPLFTEKRRKSIKNAAEFYKNATGSEVRGNLKSKLSELRERCLYAAANDKSGELAALKEELAAEEEKITSLLAEYKIEAALKDGIDILKSKAEDYARESFSESVRVKEKRENSENSERLRSEAEKFLALYPTETDSPFDEIAENTRKLSALRQRCAELQKSLSDFVSENQIDTENISAEELDGSDIEERKERLKRAMSEKITAISFYERKCEFELANIEALDTLYPERDAETERMLSYSEKYETIIKTQEFLKEAKDILTEKYLSKTHRAFGDYIELLDSASKDDFKLDTSFTLTKNEKGVLRSVESFSKGTRDIYSLVVRLALIDSLYENEKPFIILDDPFAYFDDVHKVSALKLLKELAKEKQIIYFTCTESRAV